MMNSSVTSLAALAAAALVSACAVPPGIAPANGTTTTAGLTRDRVANLDLGTEVAAFAGRTLRVLRITLTAGSRTDAHSHADLPEVVYVLDGTLTEVRNGTPVQYVAGQTFSAGKDTHHWFENRGQTPVTFLAAQIAK